jgi:uracil phosphoribosyltransferase
MVKNLGATNSIFNQFIAELRSSEIQADRMRFRRNLERVGEIFAYEISKTFEYNPTEITTLWALLKFHSSTINLY